MQLIRQFHQIETEHALFDLGKERELPVWDVVRYHVYLKYYYPGDEETKIAFVRPHPLRDYIYLAGHLVRALGKMLFQSGENLFITCSRSLDAQGKYFDRSAAPIIELLGRNCLVLEPIFGKKLRYDHIYDFVCVFRRFFRAKPLPWEYYQRINVALVSGFGVNKMSYEELNTRYDIFQSDAFYYRWLFWLKRTRKVFIAEGNPKAALQAAHAHRATTYLLQHGGIEFDEVDVSYPSGITRESNILFADHVLTLGDYWCKGLNVPARSIVSVGNDYFYNKPNALCDDSILVISTIVHGGELSKLTRELAGLHPERKFVYKLHPNEFHLRPEYVQFFANCRNVEIVTEHDINVLVSRSCLVILIVSAVLYEALNQHRKVAIYERLNYQRQECVAGLPNVFFFSRPDQISAIMRAAVVPEDAVFFKPTNVGLLRDILAA